MNGPAEEQQPEKQENPTASSGSSLFEKFHLKQYASSAEKRADEWHAQFDKICHKISGEKDPNEEAGKEKEPSIMSQIGEIGNKSYGLMNDLSKKFEHGRHKSANESN